MARLGRLGAIVLDVRRHYSNAVVARLAIEGSRTIRDWADEVGVADAGFARCGYLLTVPERLVDACRGNIAMLQGLGLDTRFVTTEEIGEIEPELSTDDLGDPAIRLLVAYIYPMTGTPGVALPGGWDGIPGARGCTPQSCAYRDALPEFTRYGATLVGISAQPPAEQREFAERERMPYPLLSDPAMDLAAALDLPTFESARGRLFRRLTLVAERGRVVKAFYPVFPPDRDAAAVLAWLGTARARDEV